MSSPTLSIVVVAFDMARELPKTLFSLSSVYQEGVDAAEYEVVVVDNGSRNPLSQRDIERFGPNFRLYEVKNASPSPVAAINLGAAHARGQFLGIMIDGARLLTPGVLRQALVALRGHVSPVVATLSWHLGPHLQSRSIELGYTKAEEDRLLASIDWERNGYRLFEISSLAASSGRGWFAPLTESNCLFMSRQAFERIGGYDERFDLPGGGLASLDFYARACEEPGAHLMILLGEGSFHQLHGGIATNATRAEQAMRMRVWARQYRALRQKSYTRPTQRPEYLGSVPANAARWVTPTVLRWASRISPGSRAFRALGRLRRGAGSVLRRISTRG